MAELKIKVYQISVNDLKRILSKFPAFASAGLTSLAKKQGAFEDPFTGMGWYFTRNKAENRWVIYVGFTGGLVSYSAACAETGLRIGMHVEYDPNGEIVQTLREEKRKALIWDPDSRSRKRVFDKAPVVTFGGIDYIWMNKEECELGQSKTMELISLKLLAKADPFDKHDFNNEYKDATALHDQSFEIATKNCTPQEKAKIVPVVMSDEDNYMSATPVSELQETKNQKDDYSPLQTLSKDTGK